MTRIVFYFAIGTALLFCPWASWWNHNFFLSHFAWLGTVGRNYFVRGAISGLGVTDVWLAIEEIHRSVAPSETAAMRLLG